MLETHSSSPVHQFASQPHNQSTKQSISQ